MSGSDIISLADGCLHDKRTLLIEYGTGMSPKVYCNYGGFISRKGYIDGIGAQESKESIGNKEYTVYKSRIDTILTESADNDYYTAHIAVENYDVLVNEEIGILQIAGSLYYIDDSFSYNIEEIHDNEDENIVIGFVATRIS